MLNYLRDLVKPWVQLIPGGKKVSDDAFGVAQELIDTHGDEVNEILSNARDEIQQVLAGQDTLDPSIGFKVASVLATRLTQLSEIAQRAGESGFARLAKKYPQVSDTLGSVYDRLHRMAEKAGPEAQKMVEDTTREVCLCGILHSC